jgi:hypothetical protein
MWISTQTKRTSLSPRLRQKIETFVSRTFRRERRYIGSVVVGIAPATTGRDVGYDCRLTVWSHYLGLIVVSHRGDTIRTAVQQAALRCREVLRQRVEKRRSKTRRATRGGLRRWSADLALE